MAARQQGRVWAGREFRRRRLPASPLRFRRATARVLASRLPPNSCRSSATRVRAPDAGGFKSGGEAGGPGAYHQHVAVLIELVVGVGIPTMRALRPKPAARRSTRSHIIHRRGGPMKIL